MGMVATDALDDAFETVPRLIGSSNFATWERGIEVALAKTGHLDLIAEDSTEEPPGMWDSNDRQISAFILGTCDKSIMSQHIHIFKAKSPDRARAVFQALKKSYGVMAHVSVLALAITFLGSRYREGEDLRVWTDTMRAQHRAPVDAKVTMEDMAVAVLLRGLPPRFSDLVDRILVSSDKMPKLDDVIRAIESVDAMQQMRMQKNSAR